MIPTILEGAKNVAYDRVYNTKGIRRVYYAGGTLCVDYVEKLPKTSYILMFNLNETVNIMNCTEGNADDDNKYLLSIPDLKNIFEIYLRVKGEKDYFKEKYSKSCIRHLITDYDSWVGNNIQKVK